MSLLDYASARPYARSIKTKVLAREMPPWFADSRPGQFANDPTLTPQQIDTLARWVDAGAPAGDSLDAPSPIVWPADGWRIKPDIVIKGVEYRVPPKGILPWMYFRVPTGFTEDTWVTSMELRSGSVVRLTHHYCLFVVPHRDDATYGLMDIKGALAQGTATGNAPFEGCYEPGQQAFDYRTQHAARLIPANSDLIFQVHYNTLGQEMVDQPQVGFTVTKERPARQYTFQFVGAGLRINIPPNEANYVPPLQEAELAVDAEIIWMQPHAHFRAKEMTFTIAYPDGRTEDALHVRYNPYWQLLYYPATPLVARKGTVLRIQGRYDNSTNNKLNPDPNAPVRFGEQYMDEMLFPTFGMLVDGALDLRTIPVITPSARAAPAPDFSVVTNSTP